MFETSVYGHGNDVVLLSGLPVPPASVDSIRQDLENDYRVIVPHLDGIGIDTVAALGELEATLDELGVRRAACVGHSYGTYRAFQLADSDSIEVSAIVAIGPLAYMPDDRLSGYEELAAGVEAGELGLDDLAGVALEQWYTPSYAEAHPELAGRIHGWFESMGPEAIAQSLRVECRGPDLRPRLAHLDVPVYLRVGEQDIATPKEWAQEIAELVPDAHLDVVDGVGHFVHEVDREATNAAIRAFLAE